MTIHFYLLKYVFLYFVIKLALISNLFILDRYPIIISRSIEILRTWIVVSLDIVIKLPGNIQVNDVNRCGSIYNIYVLFYTL